MGFTDLLSIIPSSKALRPSHYDEELVERPSVAGNTNTLVNSNIASRVENSSDVIGQDFSNRSLANFEIKIIVAFISCIAQSITSCDNSPHTSRKLLFLLMIQKLTSKASLSRTRSSYISF